MSDLATTSAFYAARPRLQLDGRDRPLLAEGLLTLLVEETTGGLYRCEATFGNWGGTNGTVGYLYLNRQLFDFGKRLMITAGDGEAEARIFAGRVSAVEAHYPQVRPPEVTVLAEDRLQDLRMTRRSRTFTDVRAADLFRHIAGEHGLQAELDVDGPTYRVLAQVNQSDLAFLRERARAVDADLWIADDTLHVQAHSRRRTGDLSLTYGQRLIEFSVMADVARQATSLTVTGWDANSKEALSGEAGAAALQSEAGSFESGPQVLKARFGKHPQQVVHLAPRTQAEAQALADAHFRAQARRFVTGRGVAEGDGRLRVGARVTLSGLGTMFVGAYTVTGVRHTFDSDKGYRTTFTVERPGVRPA